MALIMGVMDQKREGKELLDKLRVVDPFVMIAGGAPRDWYFDRSAKDLDIYLRLPNHNTITLVENLARAVGITGLGQLSKTSESSYAELPNLKWVFAGEYNGMPINLMVMDKGVREEIIKDFDVAICRAWFDGDKCHYFEEFDFCIKTRVCLVHPKYTGKEQHLRKMAKRFPQFMFFKKVEIEEEPDVSFDMPSPLPPFAPEPMPRRKKSLDDAWDDKF